MRRKIPASNTLLCFDAATSHRSLTRAAVELVLTQSAASRQIHALVKYLGAALFERTHHGMELTPVGVDYAARLAQRQGDFARRHPGVTVHFETRTRPFLFSDTALDAACPDLITSYTQIGGNHLGNKSDEIQTKSIRRKLQAASGGNDPRARPEPGSGLPGHEAGRDGRETLAGTV